MEFKWGSFLGKTFLKWISYRIIQFSLIIIVVFTFCFWYFDVKYPQIDLIFQFWVEIIAVFCALLFGFYWDRAHEIIEYENRLTKILDLFYEELHENQSLVTKIFEHGRGVFYPISLRSTVWDVYKNELGKSKIELVDNLTKTYYKIILLNEIIIKYYGDRHITSDIYEKIIKIRDETKKEINSVLSQYEKFYS